MKTSRLFGLTGLACAGALLVGSVSAADGNGEGKTARYEFRKPLDNGRGVSSLEELRGKPVLIDFWGTR
jgi:hypothetical protein